MHPATRRNLDPLDLELADCAFRKRTGVTVIAILRESESIAGAQPEDSILEGDTIVVVGKAGQFSTVKRLLASGPDESEP